MGRLWRVLVGGDREKQVDRRQKKKSRGKEDTNTSRLSMKKGGDLGPGLWPCEKFENFGN